MSTSQGEKATLVEGMALKTTAARANFGARDDCCTQQGRNPKATNNKPAVCCQHSARRVAIERSPSVVAVQLGLAHIAVTGTL
eukprot:2152460-Alexandrium_andersonii.AAC.1